MADGRGSPWEFDPGPDRGSGWADLFAQTPNYRGFGKAVLGREAFRWHFGPMFYRGRLDGSARVLVIGQEGAQDESLSHRSFTGGTGGHMQHFLAHLGIERSYLFLNTFVYPIFGQYTAGLRTLAQDPRSPLVAHRHRVLDKAHDTGDLRLVIAVGLAAKESVATWITSHGGTADPGRLHDATPGDLSAGLRFLGVMHPGAAAAGSAAAVKADFLAASGQVQAWRSADPGWLRADPGAIGSGAPYSYKSSPIAHRDFSFGSCPRLGRGATSSNRGDGQRSIQLFSAAGAYNARGARLDYPYTATGTDEGYQPELGDLAYEPPRARPRDFDPGPPPALAQLLLGLSPGLAWPDFAAAGVTSHPSFGVGAIYRGRFSGLSVVVLADPASQDDLFCGRALCGEAGQRFQVVLGAAGLTTSYLILRTVPVDISDLPATKRNALVDRAQTRALHSAILAEVRRTNPGLVALLAMGPGARRLAPRVAGDLPVIELKAWGEGGASGASGVAASWQAALDRLATSGLAPDVANPTFRYPGGWGQVPRHDLPYGTQRWMGTSGDRASRPLDRATVKPSGDYLKLFLPTWLTRLAPAALSGAELGLAEELR